MKENDSFMYECFMCGCKFQFVDHRYNGKRIIKYDIMVCTRCYDGNWDGWGPNCEEKLINHLSGRGVKIPERNRFGWIPRD